MSHWTEHGGILTTESGREVHLTVDEVYYLLNRDADLNPDPVDYAALLQEAQWGGMVNANPDGRTRLVDAASSVGGFGVRFGTSDRHAQAMERYAVGRTSMTSVGLTRHDDETAAHYLNSVTVWTDETRTEGWTNLYGFANEVATERARANAAQRTNATRKRAGRRPSCECGTCTKCRARARKQAQRDRQADLANAAADARTANVPVATASERWG